jgi:hypothetical protein
MAASSNPNQHGYHIVKMAIMHLLGLAGLYRPHLDKIAQLLVQYIILLMLHKDEWAAWRQCLPTVLSDHQARCGHAL